jgi:hypothetical protein
MKRPGKLGRRLVRATAASATAVTDSVIELDALHQLLQPRRAIDLGPAADLEESRPSPRRGVKDQRGRKKVFAADHRLEDDDLDRPSPIIPLEAHGVETRSIPQPGREPRYLYCQVVAHPPAPARWRRIAGDKRDRPDGRPIRDTSGGGAVEDCLILVHNVSTRVGQRLQATTKAKPRVTKSG